MFRLKLKNINKVAGTRRKGYDFMRHIHQPQGGAHFSLVPPYVKKIYSDLGGARDVYTHYTMYMHNNALNRNE